MNNKIVMSPNEMRILSKKFSLKSDEVKEILNSLNKEMNTLSKYWDGEAKKQFINKYNTDKRKMSELSERLQIISRDLTNITTQVEELDRRLSSRM